eukprot:2906719-Pyramimonas_sp.AAC.1
MICPAAAPATLQESQQAHAVSHRCSLNECSSTQKPSTNLENAFRPRRGVHQNHPAPEPPPPRLPPALGNRKRPREIPRRPPDAHIYLQYPKRTEQIPKQFQEASAIASEAPRETPRRHATEHPNSLSFHAGTVAGFAEGSDIDSDMGLSRAPFEKVLPHNLLPTSTPKPALGRKHRTSPTHTLQNACGIMLRPATLIEATSQAPN